jgi:hypothetical protein
MSDDPDFPKANHALQVLRQARLSRNDTAAIIVVEWNGSARVKVGGAPPRRRADAISRNRAAIHCHRRAPQSPKAPIPRP